MKSKSQGIVRRITEDNATDWELESLKGNGMAIGGGIHIDDKLSVICLISSAFFLRKTDLIVFGLDNGVFSRIAIGENYGADTITVNPFRLIVNIPKLNIENHNTLVKELKRLISRCKAGETNADLWVVNQSISNFMTAHKNTNYSEDLDKLIKVKK